MMVTLMGASSGEKALPSISSQYGHVEFSNHPLSRDFSRTTEHDLLKQQH
jgi:hypothetical protein